MLDLWIKHGLRDDDSSIKGGHVSLTTKRDQEVYLYARPTWRGTDGVAPVEDGDMYPDLDPTVPGLAGLEFYRPEPVEVLKKLPEIRPSVLYVFGKDSSFSSEKGWAEKVDNTGTGTGGSGGVKAGRVKQLVVPNAGHFVALEQVNETADGIVDFLNIGLKKWRDNAKAFQKSWVEKPLRDKQDIDDRWRKEISLRKEGNPSIAAKPGSKL